MRDRKYVTRLLALIVSTCEPFDPRSIKPTIKPTLQRIELITLYTYFFYYHLLWIMESTQQLQPLDSLDTFLIMLDYDCETPALQLPDLDELHDSSQDNPSTTTSSSEVEPNSLPQSMCLAAVPFLTQKSKTKLYFQNHTFTKKYDQKTSTIWRCSSRKCKGSIKTTPSTYEVIDATPHTCSPLTDYEYNILLSENDIVNDTSSSSTLDLANACHHPYSKTLYKRKGLGHGPERAWVTVPKGPGSRSRKGLGHVVTGSRGLGMSSKRAWVTVPKGPGSGSRKGLGNGPERAWVTVPKGPGSRGNRVTWPRHEFQKGLGHGPERAWVRVPKGPGSRGNWVTWPRYEFQNWVTWPMYEFQKGLGQGPERA